MGLSLERRLQIGAAVSLIGILLVAGLSLLTLDRVMEADALKRTRTQVEAAASIVASFERAAQTGSLSDQDAKAQARNVLSQIRYDDGNYVFILGDQGHMIMHPIKPKLDGKPLADLTDAKGNRFFQALYAGAAAKGATVVRYVWPKPGSDTPAPKVSYAVSLPGWDWVIASGVYTDDVNAAVAQQALIAGLVTLFVMAIAGSLTVISAGAVTTAVKLAVEELSALSRGLFDRDIKGAERKDEIGQIAGSIARLQAALREKARLESEALTHQADVQSRLAQAEKAHKIAVADQTAALTALRAGLQDLAAGRLLAQIEAPFAEGYEPLRADFNAALNRLEAVVQKISGQAEAIRHGAGEIATASDDMSQRTEQQAASLEETAAALDQITATVRRTADGAREASAVVAEARTDAQHSGEVVNEAVSAMSAIEVSSKQVNQIIGVIDEIAFQTNLLALNAGVEAARAGDAGRGFAVVAQEVRALAQRSAEAAKEIKRLILVSTQQVEAGVSLVGETGRALERIVREVGQINELVTGIAASAQEQSAGLAQINTAVNQMDQVTQQNAAMVEQSTAASHALAREGQALTDLMSQFDVGDGDGRAQPARRRRTAGL